MKQQRGIVVGIVLLGCLAAFLYEFLTRVPAEPRPAAVPPASAPSPGVADSAPRPMQSPALPAQPPARVASAPSPKPAAEEPTQAPMQQLKVPAHWLLRGSAPQNYSLASERDVVWAGSASARLQSHSGEVQPNQTGSLMQKSSAGGFAGMKVQFSLAVLIEAEPRSEVSVWLRADDAINTVVADHVEDVRSGRDSYDRQWHTVRIVTDVPASATALAYGVTLTGRGTVWIDEVRLASVDKHIPLTAPYAKLGVLGATTSSAREGDASEGPRNLGFEETELQHERARSLPPDPISSARF